MQKVLIRAGMVGPFRKSSKIGCRPGHEVSRRRRPRQAAHPAGRRRFSAQPESAKGKGETHAKLAAQASRAVNTSRTLRNWVIGFHITEYEQHGTDRGKYGDRLIERLSDRLTTVSSLTRHAIRP